MTEVEIAWLAGILEGEGCFAWYPRRGKQRAKLTVHVGMCDEDVIRRVASLLKVGVTSHQPRYPGSKRVYHAGVSSLEAKELMWQLVDHMGARRRETVLRALADYYESRMRPCTRCGGEFSLSLWSKVTWTSGARHPLMWRRGPAWMPDETGTGSGEGIQDSSTPMYQVPDLVVPLRSGPASSYEELRYSLRSAEAMLPDLGEVWILGATPKWITGANLARVPQSGTKYINVRRLLRQACESEHISDPFVLTNDDIFFLTPQRLDTLRLLHGGPFTRYLDLQGRHDAYARGGRKTVELLASQGHTAPLNWGLHVPILVHKKPMLAALDLVGESVVPWHVRSTYGALAGLTGEQHRDVKIMSGAAPGVDWPYVSTSDISFRTRAVGVAIRKRFEAQSRYEH